MHDEVYVDDSESRSPQTSYAVSTLGDTSRRHAQVSPRIDSRRRTTPRIDSILGDTSTHAHSPAHSQANAYSGHAQHSPSPAKNDAYYSSAHAAPCGGGGGGEREGRHNMSQGSGNMAQAQVKILKSQLDAVEIFKSQLDAEFVM